ncbi:MAG: class I SAM-dependent methyltransferase [Maribacter sp.]|nr:class I SAM-dependent methyltransferase [Maribacter sp.]
MSTAYDPITAKHYAAYRPSLHLPILQKCLDDKAKFAYGLDVGCGTGQSALALTHFCEKVMAIDPSKAMLKNAISHDQIEYQHCNGQDLDFKPNTFDIITFAGSLYYSKSQHLLNEVVKVSKPNAKVIIYDFEILLNPTLVALGVNPPSKQQLAYDHTVDFSGLESQNLQLQNKVQEEMAFAISPENLSHLLLADNDHYTLLAGKFGEADLFEKLFDRLQEMAGSVRLQIGGLIYYTLYSSS